MALPLFGAVGAGVLAGLIQFFTTRAGAILAGLGITIIGVKSWEALLGYVIGDIQALNGAISSVTVGSGQGTHVVPVLKIIAHMGVFDFLNIVFSAYMASGSLIAAKVIYGRFK